MHSGSGTHSYGGRIKISTLMMAGSIQIRNSSNHFIRWGGFLIDAHETLSFTAHHGTLNAGHWKERQEELHLVCEIHARREAIDSGNV